jgi:hypothetical protein
MILLVGTTRHGMNAGRRGPSLAFNAFDQLSTRGGYLADQGGRLDSPESMTRLMDDDRAGVWVVDLDLML